MAQEKLPIKFFAHREIDNMRVEPGGTDYLPDWVLTEDQLSSRSSTLFKSLEGFKNTLEKKEKSNSLVPLVVKAKITNDALAKTHRKEMTSLLRVGNLNNIIGLANSDELLFKIDNIEESNIIINRVKNTEKFSYALSCMETFEQFYPIIFKDKNAKVANYKIKLLDFQNYELNNSIRNYFEKTILKFGFKVNKTNYTSDLVIYNLHDVSLDSLELIRNEEIFESIFLIEPMPIYTVDLDFIQANKSTPIKTPLDGKRYVTVGVLDSGIKDIPHLKPWLEVDKWSNYPENDVDPSHGTFVSGIIVYGDQLEGTDWVGIDGCKILDANVFPDITKVKIEEDELIKNIQEAIKANCKKVKIWNLSISVSKPVVDDNFSDFAIALDDLQDEFNLLICKSVGNCRNFLIGYPKGRIYQGADSVRSLAVGSLAHMKNHFDLVDIDNPSPFTRIGRGPSYIIKPEVVHYGGNAGVDNKGDIIVNGVKSFGIDGSLTCSSGTSFSTPRITAIAAGLYQEMAEDFDPLLIKALIIHSASYSNLIKIPNSERVNQIGFGKPKNIRDILYNNSNEVTLVLRDQISKGEYLDIMDFPMPDCLIESNYFTGQIIVTLAYNPLIDSSQKGEYCQSNIDIKMGTYDRKKDRDTTKKNILNPVGRDGSRNLLLESRYSKTKMKNNTTDFALKERLLIQYQDKFYPVKKYAVDLSEITDSNKEKYLTKDKSWFLFVRGLYREHIEFKSKLESTTLSQEFCLLVTIRDPLGKKPVYDHVTQKLTENNFWHNNIKLHSDIEIRV